MMTRAAVVAEVVDGMWVLRAVVVVDVDVDGSLVACCLSPWLGGCCVPSYKNFKSSFKILAKTLKVLLKFWLQF